VDVTGSPLQGSKDRCIHQPDNRTDVALRGQPVPIEMLSSPPASSSETTASVKPSLASSRTRLDCSVFLRISLICASVETLVRMRLLSSRLIHRSSSAGWIGDGNR